MNKLKMKARSGVTLVELLVVILIVTILSVSMLPLLQPFVTESQYAAEAIPVIANIRTKVGIYQYDKGRVPNAWDSSLGTDIVETWKVSNDDSEIFAPAYYALAANADGSASAVEYWPGASTTGSDQGGNGGSAVADELAKHVGMQIDLDYQDLKGKRSKPTHYQYYVISASNNLAYAVACFGDGNGLKAGTGYAVCELNYTKLGKKFIGTWKCYKPTNEENGALRFVTDQGSARDANGRLIACYVPTVADFIDATNLEDTTAGLPAIVDNMQNAGWEFQ